MAARFRAMPRMIRELEERPESGFLGHIMSFSVIVQYWRSFDQLEAYARDPDHLHWPAWVDFNKRVGGSRGDPRLAALQRRYAQHHRHDAQRRRRQKRTERFSGRLEASFAASLPRTFGSLGAGFRCGTRWIGWRSFIARLFFSIVM